jgi:hypothetical protein
MTRKFIVGLFLAGSFSAEFAAGKSENDGNVPAQMVITVECKGAKNCPGIQQEDVMVYHDRERQKVTGLAPAQGQHLGLQLVVLMDDSSTSYLGTQLSDLKKFVQALPESTEVAIGYMRNGSPNIMGDFTRDHSQAASKLRLPLGERGGNGSPYFALSDLAKHWPSKNPADRREVLMVTDGVDRYYTSFSMDDPYVQAAISDCQKAGVLVHTIYLRDRGGLDRSNFGVTIGQSYLNMLTTETGGKAYFQGLGNPVSMSPFLDDLREQLENQYKITFVATAKKGQNLQSVRLTTELPRAAIRGATKVATSLDHKN